MKCRYCGAPLRIEDEVCPYCHQENPDAKEHREKMRKFTGEYEQTRAEVYEKTRFFTGWTVRVTIISVLVVLNLLVFVIHGMSWEIVRQWKQIKANVNRQNYEAVLNQLEEDGRYMEFSQVFSENQLRSVEQLEHFGAVQMAASEYYYLYGNIMRVVTADEDYKELPGMLAEQVSDGLGYLYRWMDEEERWDESQYTPEHLEAMENMVQEIHLLLKTYWNIREEDLENFPQMSTARRQIILEEGLGIGE